MHLFDRVNEGYSEAFRKYGDSAAAVQIPKDNQAVRFESVINFLPEPTVERLSIADFGCGLGHLNNYLCKEFERPFHYTGVEINLDFLEYNKKKFVSSNFVERDVFFLNNEKYDVITSIGTFNIIYAGDEAEHKNFVYAEIMRLWEKTSYLLHLNFMSSIVDYSQQGAYHQDVGELYAFICKNMSRKLIIDSSYLPYEFSAVVSKG
jgi:SAM-dependent methyltransferase